MYLGFGAIFILGFALWLIWSKLCDIEKKQFRMHDEMGLSLKYLEDQLHLTQSMIERLNENPLSVSQDYKDIQKRENISGKIDNKL